MPEERPIAQARPFAPLQRKKTTNISEKSVSQYVCYVKSLCIVDYTTHLRASIQTNTMRAASRNGGESADIPRTTVDI